MQLTLTRDTYTANETLGTLIVAMVVYQTIERPWVAGDSPSETAGEPGKSCVPEGLYELVPHNSVKHPHVFALVNHELGVAHEPTPGMRSEVLIHPANWARELEGCIAPGRERVQDGDVWMVTKSREALRVIMANLPWRIGHTLEIIRG